MERYQDNAARVIHTVVKYPYTVGDEQTSILSIIESDSKADFMEVFGKCENRVHAIVKFLALLELLNQQRVSITQGIGANNFWISTKEQDDSGEEE